MRTHISGRRSLASPSYRIVLLLLISFWNIISFLLFFLYVVEFLKTGVTPLPDNNSRDTYCYEIHVHTGFMRGAGTSAEVSIVLSGSLRDREPRVLKDPNRKNFKTGLYFFAKIYSQTLFGFRNTRKKFICWITWIWAHIPHVGVLHSIGFRIRIKFSSGK